MIKTKKKQRKKQLNINIYINIFKILIKKYKFKIYNR